MHESPCSVPEFLRFILPLETPRQQAACRRHDERHARGGDHRARLFADLCLALDLLGTPPEILEQVMQHGAWHAPEGAMGADNCERYLWGVRMYGGFAWPGGDTPGAPPLHPPPRFEAP